MTNEGGPMVEFIPHPSAGGPLSEWLCGEILESFLITACCRSFHALMDIFGRG
jgi:hypothetical protein